MIKEIIRKAMNDLLMKNVSCDYIVESKKSVQRLDNTLALDAYIKTVDMYLREGNVKCFMCPMGEKAVMPVLEVRNDKVTLSGNEIYHFSGKDF